MILPLPSQRFSLKQKQKQRRQHLVKGDNHYPLSLMFILL